VHHHTIQINQPTRCNNFSIYYLTFMYNTSCLGRPYAHYQELNNFSSNLWFYRWSVVVAVLQHYNVYMTSKYFFLKLVLVVNTGSKNYHKTFSQTSRIGGTSALKSQIFNHTESSCSNFRKMNLSSGYSVCCHYFMETAEFFDRTKLWRSHLT
jgi:hypothetical protein